MSDCDVIETPNVSDDKGAHIYDAQSDVICVETPRQGRKLKPRRKWDGKDK